MDFGNMESISIELNLNNVKWLIQGVYRLPNMTESKFTDDFCKTFDRCTTKYDNLMVIGYINYDLLTPKGQPLQNMCDIFYLSNLVKKPTCPPKNTEPTLIDAILTNKPLLTGKICNFNTVISDVHNLISFQFKSKIICEETTIVNI